MSVEQLRWRRSGDAVKLAAARRVRRQTTMSLAWVAEQLGVGSWRYLSQMLSNVPSENGQLTFGNGLATAASNNIS